MARGDQFRLFLIVFFFIQGLIAFVGFALLARLLNYRALKNRPMSWRIAGSVGVVIWTIRNIYVHAWDSATGHLNMDAVQILLFPAVVLPGMIGLARLLFPPAN
jgi:hypothetical protein